MPDATGAGVTLGPLYETTRRRFAARGFPAAAMEARMLICGVMGCDAAALLSRPDLPVDADRCRVLDSWVARRLAREPVGRILGEREFWSMRFRLAPDTLEPRPDTETVVAALLRHFDARAARPPRRILDIGTGSGAILVALLHEMPAAVGLGTDLSLQALVTARANAERHGVAGRARFVCADYCRGVAGRFDAIVSNPPYIPSGEIDALAPEVARFDPRIALDGGADGLRAYRALVPAAADLLRPDGVLALEVGAGQAGAVAALAVRAGFGRIDTVPDLAGHDRVVVALLP